MDCKKEKTEFISQGYYKNYKTRNEWLSHIELLEIYNRKLFNMYNNLRKVIGDNMSISEIYKINGDKVYTSLEDWEDV